MVVGVAEAVEVDAEAVAEATEIVFKVAGTKEATTEGKVAGTKEVTIEGRVATTKEVMTGVMEEATTMVVTIEAKEATTMEVMVMKEAKGAITMEAMTDHKVVAGIEVIREARTEIETGVMEVDGTKAIEAGVDTEIKVVDIMGEEVGGEMIITDKFNYEYCAFFLLLN